MLNLKINTQGIVFKAVQQVLIDNEVEEREINSHHRLVQDLNFTSLMVAQLIMLIQDEIEKEPFANDHAISDMITVSDYINVYA